jgi:hypothetical protein
MNLRMRPSGKRFAIRGFMHRRRRFFRRPVAAKYGGLNAIDAPEIGEFWQGRAFRKQLAPFVGIPVRPDGIPPLADACGVLACA